MSTLTSLRTGCVLGEQKGSAVPIAGAVLLSVVLSEMAWFHLVREPSVPGAHSRALTYSHNAHTFGRFRIELVRVLQSYVESNWSIVSRLHRFVVCPLYEIRTTKFARSANACAILSGD